ncbi:hypothetical protein GQ53DRAFT_457151 [Thozetella sp. PMI_491]|nr:hypothetical protein GQ53DRAFT_457151 [Thozetella sp. PMI_491]
MPRQLPWVVKSKPDEKSSPAANVGSTPSRTPAPTGRPRARTSMPSVPKDSSLQTDAASARRGTGGRANRSPSTSPPPQPVEEEFMIDGAEHDDRYRMVEDEFISVAGDFTRHLHAAEYQRLKTLAKSQNADTIKNISRPVSGNMTDLVRRRQRALGIAASQRQGIQAVLGKPFDADPNEPWAGTSLQGLMDSPRKSVPLKALASAVSAGRTGSSGRAGLDKSTGRGLEIPRRHTLDLGKYNQTTKRRASAVQDDSTTDSDEEDEDDLDASSVSLAMRGNPHSATKRDVTQPFRSSTWAPGGKPPSSPFPLALSSTKVFAKPRPPTPPEPFKPKTIAVAAASRPVEPDRRPIDLTKDAGHDDHDDDDFFAKRRNERDRKRKRSTITPRTGSVDDIPFI